MKAIVGKEVAPGEKLVYEEVAVPVAKKGHVVVDIKASGVNFPDALLVQGLYQIKPDFPFIPGGEVAGIISFPHFIVGVTVSDTVDDITGLRSRVVTDPKLRGTAGKEHNPMVRLAEQKGKTLDLAGPENPTH